MMAFQDSTPANPARSRYSGEGFRQEPDFRDGTVEAQAATPAVAPATDGEPTAAIPTRTPNLDHVFDDPADGEPGRDRMLVHGLWELLLLVALGGVGYLLYREDATAFSGDGLRDVLLGVTAFGLLASAGAVALRAGVVNLAVGPVAVGAALFFAENSNGGLLTPLLITLGLCAAVGAVQGLVLVGLHVPSWAVSLGAGLAVVAWTQGRPPGDSAYSAQPDAYWWLGGFCLVSILFGIVLFAPSVRRAFGRFRPVSDPADRRGWVAALIALGATVASSILAGLGGVFFLSVDVSIASMNGLPLTAMAIGIAMVGGTSAFGRRGGVFGTALAAALFAVVNAYAEAAGTDWSATAVAAATLAVGLIVTRMVEHFGRPARARAGLDEDADWLLPGRSPAPAAWPTGGTYQPPSSAQTAAGGLWASDDAWGAER